MRAAIFEVLVTSSVLIIGIFCLRKLTIGKISMRLRYGLWLLVAARLLMPVSVGTSPVSVMNLVSRVLQESIFSGGRESAAKADEEYATQMKEGDTENAFAWQNPAQGANGQHQNMITVTDQSQKNPDGSAVVSAKGGTVGRKDISPVYVIWAVWFLGFLAVSGYMLFVRARFVRYLRRNRQKIGGKEIPAAIGEKLVGRGMRVYRVKGLPSPCLVGKRIYIGEGIPEGEQRLIHILAHEYCHRVHGDGFWAFLRCALAAVYWFDPLVWAAAFAARQDSDLACDEAVVRLLGEEEQFAYGKTLLALLQESGSRTECPGMPPMFFGGERSVRERIVSLTRRNKAESIVLVAVFSMVFLICGCAFTGAQTAEEGSDISEETVEQEGQVQASVSDTGGESPKEPDGKLSPEQIAELEESALQEAQQEAFEETLNYHGAMEGKDDSELSLNRQVDVRHFYEYGAGEREDAPEEGWYLLCRDEEEVISLYGLFTEDFGCRGMKTLIGEDVNTFDLVWYPSGANRDSGNIRVLEQAQDGLPRRFVFKYMEEESSETEIWRLASGFRYDTGTVDLKVLPKEDYLSWADWHLNYQIDEERGQVRVFYDEDRSGLVGVLDISDYAGLPIEEVCVAPDTVGFDLDSEAFEGEENIALRLYVGLKLTCYEDVFINGLSPLAVQVLFNEDEGGGFRFGQPKVDEKYQIHNLRQERKLEEIRSGEGEDALAKPFDNPEGHHDVAITFVNPCPERERISDPYGERIYPLTGEKVMHNGVDMAAPLGTDVLAAADGIVYRTGYDAANGNYVVLWHEESGQMTYYTCCQDILVSEGDRVSARDKIATVGQTGRSTGPHLHFAVSYEGEWQEPVWGGRK